MVLGDGMHQMGALADRIPAGRPGVGYMTVEGVREPIRVRAAYVTDDRIHTQTLDHPAPGSALLAVPAVTSHDRRPMTAAVAVPWHGAPNGCF